MPFAQILAMLLLSNPQLVASMLRGATGLFRDLRGALPGAGGGRVGIPHLAAAAAAGDPLATATIQRQAESAERFARIDRLLAEMEAQRRALEQQQTLPGTLGMRRRVGVWQD